MLLHELIKPSVNLYFALVEARALKILREVSVQLPIFAAKIVFVLRYEIDRIVADDAPQYRFLYQIALA